MTILALPLQTRAAALTAVNGFSRFFHAFFTQFGYGGPQ